VERIGAADRARPQLSAPGGFGADAEQGAVERRADGEIREVLGREVRIVNLERASPIQLAERVGKGGERPPFILEGAHGITPDVLAAVVCDFLAGDA
jgi:hypothetical protein